MNIIEIKNVAKTYKVKKVLDNVSFSKEEGIVYSLLGTNGAGKQR